MNEFTLVIDLDNSKFLQQTNKELSGFKGFKSKTFENEKDLFDFLKKFFEFESFGIYSYSKNLFTEGDCSCNFDFDSAMNVLKDIIKKFSTCAIFTDDRIINLFNINGKRIGILRIENEISKNRFKAKQAIASASSFYVIKNTMLRDEEKIRKNNSMPNQRYTLEEYLKFRDQLFEAIEEMISFLQNHFRIIDIFKGTNYFSDYTKKDWENYSEKIKTFENLKFVFAMNKLINDSEALKLFANLIDISKLKLEYNDERMAG